MMVRQAIMLWCVFIFFSFPAIAQKCGVVKWKFEIGKCMLGLHSSPAVTSDGYIYVISDCGWLYALDSYGNLMWKKWGISSDGSAAVDSKGIVYVVADIGVRAFNPDGSLKWKWDFPPAGSNGAYYATPSSPAIGSDGTVYVAYGYNLYALDSNGSVKWKFKTNGFIASSPAVDEERKVIYFGSNDGYIYAVNCDGSLKWKFYIGGYVTSSPAIDNDGSIYIMSDQPFLYALNPDGTLKRKIFVTDKAIVVINGYAMISSPVIDVDGTIYVGSHEGGISAINPDGSYKWWAEVSELAEPFSLALGADRTIYVGSGEYLYAFNPDGNIKWKLKTEGEILSSPVIAPDGTIYIVSGKYLYAVASCSDGPAPSPWSQFHHDSAHTGRTSIPASFASLDEIFLEKGWNLIGVPYSLDVNELINDGASLVWKYSEGKWQFYSSVEKLNEIAQSYGLELITKIKEDEGLWVKVENPAKISFKGNSSKFSVEVTKGWNLKGIGCYLNEESLNREEIKVVWKYKAKDWEIYSSDERILEVAESYGIKAFHSIEPGRGFWILSNKEIVFTSEKDETPVENLYGWNSYSADGLYSNISVELLWENVVFSFEDEIWRMSVNNDVEWGDLKNELSERCEQFVPLGFLRFTIHTFEELDSYKFKDLLREGKVKHIVIGLPEKILTAEKDLTDSELEVWFYKDNTWRKLADNLELEKIGNFRMACDEGLRYLRSLPGTEHYILLPEVGINKKYDGFYPLAIVRCKLK